VLEEGCSYRGAIELRGVDLIEGSYRGAIELRGL
jgi:hypothetical protein